MLEFWFTVTIAKQDVYMKHKIIVNSLPKSGTHLLERVLNNYPQVQFSGRHIGHTKDSSYLWLRLELPLKLFNSVRIPSKDELLMVTDVPRYTSKQKLKKELVSISNNEFLTAHLPYSDQASELLQKLNYKMLLMIRDPRDVAVSFVHYVKQHRKHPLYKDFKGLSHSECLLAAINGINTKRVALRAHT